jgi:hypothetical protein
MTEVDIKPMQGAATIWTSKRYVVLKNGSTWFVLNRKTGRDVVLSKGQPDMFTKPFDPEDEDMLDALWNGVAWFSKYCAPKVRADLYGVRS